MNVDRSWSQFDMRITPTNWLLPDRGHGGCTVYWMRKRHLEASLTRLRSTAHSDKAKRLLFSEDAEFRPGLPPVSSRTGWLPVQEPLD